MNGTVYGIDCKEWRFPTVNGEVTSGDMPGDRVMIEEEHIRKAQTIFKALTDRMQEQNKKIQKLVISVYGGSGVGKSEIGSLLGFYFRRMGYGSYVLSGDNYPHRIPLYNDAERLRVFRVAGIKKLMEQGYLTAEAWSDLKLLQEQNLDSDEAQATPGAWLSAYQNAGRCALAQYLGTDRELDFSDLNRIIEAFKNGTEQIWVKRMGRTDTELWYDSVDFSGTEVLIIEWTHGGNRLLHGVDYPVFLYSSPEETLEHRRKRNRDGNVDSPFTRMVLEIEQNLLLSQICSAALIIKKDGTVADISEINCSEGAQMSNVF